MFDQTEFPGTSPFLEFLFALNRRHYITMHFVIHQVRHTVFVSETFSLVLFVLLGSLHEITCDTDIQCAIAFAGQE